MQNLADSETSNILSTASMPPNSLRRRRSRTEMMVDVLDRKEISHAYLAFEGEGHGFRKEENIVRSLEAVLSFVGQVFGFEPAGEIEPVALR